MNWTEDPSCRERQKDPRFPHPAFNKAIYEVSHNIQTLKHVYITVVANPGTILSVIRELYTPEYGFSWKDPEVRQWKYALRSIRRC